MCDFLSFPNFGTLLFWPISLLIISSDSSGLFTFGCFILCLFENLSRDKLEKDPSKFLAYIRNTIPAKSLWPPSEESPPPLPLFRCCYDDVGFSFDIFLNLQNNIGQGVWGKSKPLSNVIVWDCLKELCKICSVVLRHVNLDSLAESRQGKAGSALTLHHIK